MVDIDDLQTALKELGQAIYSHEQWYKDLNRVLICRLPYDLRDVAADAHRQCRFGQWYYGTSVTSLREHPAFVALANEHEQMHTTATRLLKASQHAVTIEPSDYDTFVNSLDRMRLQLQELKHELETSLYHRDALTGAESRVGMITRLREQLELVRRRVQQCCIAVMDLDRFKEINDKFGHRVGDEVLAGAVRHVKDHLRPYDKVFRYGGEEFLIVLANTDLEAGQTIIERMRLGLSAVALTHSAGQPVFATASFGMALLESDVSVEQSMDRADKAMYAAKTAGRNRLHVWGPGEGD